MPFLLSITLKKLEITFTRVNISKYPGGGPPDPLSSTTFDGCLYLTHEHVCTKQKVHATHLLVVIKASVIKYTIMHHAFVYYSLYKKLN